MALSTFAELKTAIAALLNRTDLTTAIPDFVALFEADFDADPRTAHHRRRICRSTATIDAEYEALAENYLSIQSIGLETDPIQWLQYVDPDSVVRMKQDQDAWRSNQAVDFGADPGPPKYYTIVGTEIRFFPVPETEYTCNLTVYERLSQLVEDTDDNWLLTYFPQLYLYGSALHAAPYLDHDERIPTWKAFFDEGVAKLMASDPNPTSKATLRTDLVGMASNNRGVWW